MLVADAANVDEDPRRRSGRITSALFVDFDNMFGGLLALDRNSGVAFAESPGVWLKSLATFGLSDQYRDVLVRRVYLNPNGSLHDSALGNERGRLYLQKYRPYLTQAGFDVVDCPALTSQNKNAADIRIVIDVLEALRSGTHYDEIIIGSSDADFTPLLQKLRAADRRTVIMSASTTSPAYRNIAHAVLEAEDVVELINGRNGAATPLQTGPTVPSAAGASRTSVTTGIAETDASEDVAPMIRKAEELVSEAITSSDHPVLMAQLGVAVRQALMETGVDAGDWFGHRSLAALIRSIEGGRFKVTGHHAWEPGRHEEPAEHQASEFQTDLPDVIVSLNKVTDLPRLSSGTWRALIRKLIEYAHGHSFNLTESTAWVRDELADSAHPVGRQAVAFVVRALAIGGANLAGDTPPKFDECVDAVLSSVSDRAAATGWDLSDEESDIFRDWIAGDGTNAAELVG